MLSHLHMLENTVFEYLEIVASWGRRTSAWKRSCLGSDEIGPVRPLLHNKISAIICKYRERKRII